MKPIFSPLLLSVALLPPLLSAPLSLMSSPAQSQEQSREQPQRIIAVGGALTEIVYALGAQQRLVAVDTTSTFPAETLKLAKVGYMRQLSSEGVLSMKPSVVLATNEAGPPAVMSQLKSAGVKFEIMNADHSFEELRNKVRVVSAALGLQAQGAKLDDSITAEWKATQEFVARNGRKPRVLFLMLHSASGGLMASGEGTAADAVIRYAGGINAVSGYKGYKPLAEEAVIAAAPDFVLLTREGLDAIGGIDKLWQKPGLGFTPAAKNKRYAAPDALYLLGFGPRLPKAVRELAEKLQAGA